MGQVVTGSILNQNSLLTTFSGGTAGIATERNNLGTKPIQIGPGNIEFGDVYSDVLVGLTGTTTLDLTALPGIGTRTITLSLLKYVWVVNCDPTAGHDVQIGPGASDGLEAPFAGSGDYWNVLGGMPGAGLVTVSNGKQPTGNIFSTMNMLGWTVDATHKTLQIVVPTGTVTNLAVLLAG